MKYELLTDENLNDILTLYVEAFNGEPWNDKWTEERVFDRLHQMLSCEGAYGLVAYEEEKPVGVILGNHEYYYDGMHFQIKEFCVDNRVKGKGYGSKLLDTFLGQLKEKGIDEVMLLTLKSNATEGFYEKKGFKTMQDMIWMMKPLSGE